MSLSSFDSVPPVYLIFIISMAWIYLLPQAFMVPSWGWWVSFPIVRGLPSSSSQISLLVFWYPPTLFELDFNSSCSFEKFNSWSRDLCRAQLGFGLNFGLPSPTSCAVFFRFNTTGTLFISPVRQRYIPVSLSREKSDWFFQLWTGPS